MSDILNKETQRRLLAISDYPMIGNDVQKALTWINVQDMKIETFRRVLAEVSAEAGISDDAINEMLSRHLEAVTTDHRVMFSPNKPSEGK